MGLEPSSMTYSIPFILSSCLCFLSGGSRLFRSRYQTARWKSTARLLSAQDRIRCIVSPLLAQDRPQPVDCGLVGWLAALAPVIEHLA